MKILVIRRDNIGDLVCTTPLLRCLSAQIPGAVIDVLANEYNYQVLEGNPDVRKIWIYQKAKHRQEGHSRLGVWLKSLRLLLRVRRERYDYVIIASPGYQSSAVRLARYSGARFILGYAHPGAGVSAGLPAEEAALGHEVEATLRLASLLGLDVRHVPPLRLVPQPDLRQRYCEKFPCLGRTVLAVHISARKPSQRWPAEYFAALLKVLCMEHGVQILLFWSPGATDDVLHPGDDEKALEITKMCAGLPVFPVKTTDLRSLVAALSLAGGYIGADGGAMHLAAGIGLPIVAFFGQSDCQRWRPWGERTCILQPASRNVADISVDEVVSACLRLGMISNGKIKETVS